MASTRLSFRLPKDSQEQEVWHKLKERHPEKKDQQIFAELLRREGIRLDNKETNTDILKEMREMMRLLWAFVQEGKS